MLADLTSCAFCALCSFTFRRNILSTRVVFDLSDLGCCDCRYPSTRVNLSKRNMREKKRKEDKANAKKALF